MMVWWLTCFARVPRPPSFNIYVAFYASLCSYSAPGLRWFLVSGLETGAVWVCGVRGAGKLTSESPPLNLLTSKGRAPCACGAGRLRDAGSMVVWWRASSWYGWTHVRQCAHGVCRVTPTAGILLGPEIQ